MNTNIENCDIQALEKQKESLMHEIVYGKNAGHFAVFDIEAGCRKTRTAELALIEAYNNGKNSLLVRRSDNDCRESMNIINKITGENIAFAYNNEDVVYPHIHNINKTLYKVPIVIITHQKYKVLMKDPAKKKFFTEGRRNLIVDEFISTIDIISLSESDIETYRTLFKNDFIILRAYERALSQLIDFLKTWNKENTTRRFVTITDRHPAKDFAELIKLIRANVTNATLLEWRNSIIQSPELYQSINLNLLFTLNTERKLRDQLLSYKQLYMGMCLYSDKKLYTTDKRYEYWFLDNNIMLDASGELQSAYSLNQDEFVLQHCEKVLDHNKWKIINIPVNTTSACKEKILNFYDIVNEKIKKYGDDILIIGKKDEMDMISAPDENKGYFGNVTGSNKWYDKRNVAIIQTHNLSDVDYILKYLHYAKKKIDSEFTLSAKCNGRKERKSYSFNDNRLEEIRVKWIASEIYQAIKRVNRNMRYDTDALIFINNEQVIELLKNHMKNAHVEILQYDEDEFVFETSKQDEYLQELKKDSYASKFVEFLAEAQNGLHSELVDDNRRISKIKVREYLGIKTSGNFSNKVLNKSEVIRYCEARKINITGQYIKLPKTG